VHCCSERLCCARDPVPVGGVADHFRAPVTRWRASERVETRCARGDIYQQKSALRKLTIPALALILLFRAALREHHSNAAANKHRTRNVGR